MEGNSEGRLGLCLLSRKLAMRVATAALVLAWCSAAMGQNALPDRVTLLSLDDRTTLVGYIYAPRAEPGHLATPMPAVVMMHGHSGAYSSLANGKYDAATISQRHQMWVSCRPSRVTWRS